MTGQLAIIWPTIALVALIFVIWFVMYVQRFALMRQMPPSAEDFASNEAALRYFAPVEMSAANLRNLLEMPVLYFALIPLLLISGHANDVQLGLAWLFVALRAVHSVVHVRRGKVALRFVVYALSCAALLAMWIGLAVDLATAA